MKKQSYPKLSQILLLFTCLLFACSSNSDLEPEPKEVIGVEVSGTSFNGNYMLDTTHTKGIKYTNESDENQRIITYEIAKTGAQMWGLMVGNTLYYKIEQVGEYPPASDWDCGIGVPKDQFKIVLIYQE